MLCCRQEEFAPNEPFANSKQSGLSKYPQDMREPKLFLLICGEVCHTERKSTALHRGKGGPSKRLELLIGEGMKKNKRHKKLAPGKYDLPVIDMT